MGMADANPDVSSILAPATTEVEYVARTLAIQNYLIVAPGEANRPNLRWVADEVEMDWTSFRQAANAAINAVETWRARVAPTITANLEKS